MDPQLNSNTNKDAVLKFDYKECLKRGRMFCMTPKSITIASVMAFTSWNIKDKDDVGLMLESPLSTIIYVGIGSFIINGCAEMISECLPYNGKPIVPLMLFGSTAYHLNKAFICHPKYDQNFDKQKNKDWKIEFGNNHKNRTQAIELKKE